MKLLALQFFFVAITNLWAATGATELSLGQVYSVKFQDVDGNTFSTADGRVTVVVLTTSAHADQAEQVGEHIPDHCLGNSGFRMVTVVDFKQHGELVRSFLTKMARRRLDAAAKRLQLRYQQKQIGRNARADVFAVTDFDGLVTAQLGGLPDSAGVRVFVFSPKGELLQEWNGVPTVAQLAVL